MKLIVTQKRIDANKKNGQLGAIAYREKRKALYEAKPSFCSHCSVMLPQDKKNNIPISKGGLHTLSNLQYLTVTENRRKSNKIIV